MKGSTILLFLIFFFFKNISASDIPNFHIYQNTDIEEPYVIASYTDSTNLIDVNYLDSNQNLFTLSSTSFFVKSTDHANWFAFSITNKTNASINRIIGFNESNVSAVDLYYKSNNSWIHKKSGLQIPQNQREIFHRWPVFKVQIAPNQTVTYYLRYKTPFLSAVKILVKKEHSFFVANNTYNYLYWFYFGAAIAIILFNLGLFLQLKERVYLYYILHAINLLIFAFVYSGFIQLINHKPEIHYALHSAVAVMGVFINLFTREFLNTKEIQPTIDKIIQIIAVCYGILFVLIIVDINFYKLLVYLGSPSMIFLLLIGILAKKQKSPLATYYLFAMSFYLIGLTLIASVNLGWVPLNNFTRFGYLVGSFIELILFSLALGYRYKIIMNEKQRIQQELLERETQYKEILEKQVKERTASLNETTEELKVVNENLSNEVNKKNEILAALEISEEKLKESNDTKDKFFSIIAHDLKGPVGNFYYILNEFSPENIPLEIYDNLKLSAQNTFELLLDLLSWARSHKKEIEYNYSNFSVDRLFSKMSSIFAMTFKNKDITLKNNISSKDIYVYADLPTVSTILRNLISNAIKFTKKGGEITLSASVDSHFIIIKVKDNGVGISEQKRKKLFKIGESDISSPGTNNETGSGIGLLLCKEFTEGNNGTIGVESEVDKGSEFWFTLPIGQNINEEDIVHLIRSKQFEVLVVEDNYLNLQTTISTIKKLGMISNVATDGEEGLKLGLEREYDIIFMDINLPKYDGIYITSKIREKYPNSIIIALSSFDKTDIQNMDNTLIFNDYLKKPLTVESLVECYKSLIDEL